MCQKRAKLDDRGRKLIFVGYPTNVKGFRLLDPNDGYKLVISKSVKFDEGSFCFRKESTKSNNNKSLSEEDLLQIRIRGEEDHDTQWFQIPKT